MELSKIKRKECTVKRNSSLRWKSDNSEVQSIPSLTVGTDCVKCVGVSLVTICGPSGEDLHFHKADIVGLVIYGAARLRFRSEGDIERVSNVVENDVVFIPRGVFHLFECCLGETMRYVALELSESELDYQKHWS